MVEQDKRGEDEEVHYDNRDEVRDAAPHDCQDATEEAGEKAEREESCPGQMAFIRLMPRKATAYTTASIV